MQSKFFLEDEDDDGGGSPFDDENDLQDLVEDAIYRFPLGDHDTGRLFCHLLHSYYGKFGV